MNRALRYKMPDQHKLESLYYLLTAFICLAARFYLLPQIGLTDYDSIRSWQIVQELGQGNFKHLFHHASPGFFLLYAVFTPFLKGVLGYILLNSLFNVGAVLLLIRFMRQHLAVPLPEAFLTGLIFGLSVFAVSTGRNFATESISIFLFMLMLEQYYRRLHHKSAHAFLKAAAWLALGLTINYKLLLVFPIILLIELFQRDKVLSPKLLLKLALIILAPFVLFGLIAVLVNKPFYQFPATIVSINHFTRPTPALRTGRFNLDWEYYGRYLLDFEWPVLLPALFLFPFLYRQQLFSFKGQKLNIYQFLFIISYLYLLGMQLLVKAPRGLMFVYGLFYALTYLVLNYIIPKRWVILVILFSGISYQVYQLNKNIYLYAPTNYPAVVKYLEENNIAKVVTTVGLNIVPHTTGKAIETKIIFSEKELPALKQAGFTHVLLDDYYKITNVQQFAGLEKIKTEKDWPEPTLLSPLLYLDHSEFTGLSYTQTLANQRKAQKSSVQLRLIKIP
ncbi:ArnT family glycosyltransferase [Adhaeribacter rhizoryzae]|uniref:Glycosyltransferase RgtA/B/C/D-like domain-containing protein n=1 Tax=Adhaeribacter rhizoryzae TaxID=2607907 RepID=A0A5M6DQR9_9BACT|nr:glycosyltransferase family 39 protein [Adhaeribacter rhizoryzae]KAA5548696.1 hypothetical protein F0145_04050 [Adhaeribacter rhizoryzae]